MVKTFNLLNLTIEKKLKKAVKNMNDAFYKYSEERQVKREILMASSYWIISKDLYKLLGLEATLILTLLIEKHDSLVRRKQIKYGDSFYYTVDDLESVCRFSKHQQTKALKELSSQGFIDVIRQDGKREITIHLDELKFFISEAKQ